MRSLLLLTLLSGPAVAALLAPPTFVAAALPVHGTISLFVPLLAIVLDRAHRRRALIAAVVAAALVGNAACAVAAGAWDTRLALGGLATQVLAALVGIAGGRCLRSRGLAMVGVTVVPIGCWAVLGAIGATTAQAWLTPYGVVVDLLSGTGGTLVGVRFAALSAAAVWVCSRAGARSGTHEDVSPKERPRPTGGPRRDRPPRRRTGR